MNRLKELRKEKKLTQQELANIAGVTKRSYIYWENGERQIKPDKAQLLADHFGVSVGYLLGYSEYKDGQEASFQLNQNDPDDHYNYVKSRIYSILGDDLVEVLEKQYRTGYDGSDDSHLLSFLSAVNQLSYTEEETMLLNYGILPKEDKKIINNLVSDMAEKVKKANKKEPWQIKF